MMATVDIRQRTVYLFLAVIVGHVILISAQVNTARGVPMLEAVVFGTFAEVQRLANSAVAGTRGVWDGYVGLRRVAADNERLRQDVSQLQLRLQETVEGLSVAAVTYYIVGLVGYLAKGLKAGGVHLDPEITMAASIPVVAVIVALGVRKIRLMTNNPDKVAALEKYGLDVVERVAVEVPPRAANRNYLQTKRTKFGHLLSMTGIADKPE